MRIPVVDLKAQYQTIKQEIDEAVLRVLKNSTFVFGPEVESLENEIAAYCGVKYAIGVASGTDALYLSLIAIGINPGDEVITTPFTFFATAETISHLGAVPVFVDIDPETYNIDPARIEEKITSRTRAILPVHLYGHPANMEPIMHIAKGYNLHIIEDCAQAIGALYQGKSVGSFGDTGCFSFYPSKNLGGYGDGGMVITNNENIANCVRKLRNHGSESKYYYSILGFNSRLDGIQAAVLRVKLRHLPEWIKVRREIACNYNQRLQNSPLITPYEAPYAQHVYHQYTIRVKNREKLQKYLLQKGISTAIYYPLSLHLQEVYTSLGYKRGDLPVSETCEKEVLSLPMYPELTEEMQEYICQALCSALEV